MVLITVASNYYRAVFKYIDPLTGSAKLDMSDFWEGDVRSFFDGLSLPKPSSFPTAVEVQAEAHLLSKEIFLNWITLHKVLERHEERLRKRWTKRTQDQRKQILLNAWPKMSLHTDQITMRFVKNSPNSEWPEASLMMLVYDRISILKIWLNGSQCFSSSTSVAGTSRTYLLISITTTHISARWLVCTVLLFLISTLYSSMSRLHRRPTAGLSHRIMTTKHLNY